MRTRPSIAIELVLLLSLGSALASLSCSAAGSAYRKGRSSAQLRDWDAAVVHYTRAVNEDPDNIEYRIALEHALVQAATQHVHEAQKKLAAEDLRGAIAELELATNLDPTNRNAQSILEETRAQLQEREALREEAVQFEERRRRAQELFGIRPILEPASTAPIQLRFAEDTSLQKIFEVLSKLSGINILFDESFRDKRITLDLVDVSFQEALDKLVLIHRLFYKIVDPATIIIIPDNAQKHRQYDDLVLRTFYIVNAEVNTVANMLRTIAGIQRVQPNPELKSITVRATPDQVAVAERIVELNDKSKSEIMLDIEILEINRNKMLEYGLQAAEYQIGLRFAPAGQDPDTGALRLNRLASVDSSDFLITFPSSAAFRLFKSRSEARLLASPKLRATEGQPAELRLGQEVPIPVTSFVSQFGTGGVPQTPVTSFQYRNVGLNITITPKVFVDGEIELQLALETSSQLDTRLIGGIELPVFGLRNVNNVVRLRDGETNLIGGLISEDQRRGISGVPGVTDVPLLNKIFAFNDEETAQNDIVFSITPHIVRAPRVTEEDMAPLPMGTEQQIKVPGAPPSVFDASRDRPPPPEEPASEPAAEPEPTPEPEPTEPEPEPTEPEPEPAAPPPISVLFSPPTLSLTVGESAEVVLLAGGAQGLSSGTIRLDYDSEVLRIVNVQPGAFLSIDGFPVSFTPTFNPDRVDIEFLRAGDTVGLAGSGHLVRLTIEALEPATSVVVSPVGLLRNPSGQTLRSSFASLQVEVQ